MTTNRSCFTRIIGHKSLTVHPIYTKFDTIGFTFGLPFCVPNSKEIGVRVAVYNNFCKCAKTRRIIIIIIKNETLAVRISENGLSDFLQIWNVNSPSWRATLQQIWFQYDKVSQRYKGVKITFPFFLSRQPRCGAPASCAA